MKEKYKEKILNLCIVWESKEHEQKVEDKMKIGSTQVIHLNLGSRVETTKELSYVVFKISL